MRTKLVLDIQRSTGLTLWSRRRRGSGADDRHVGYNFVMNDKNEALMVTI